ncbi:MAG: MFS transporter [Candidatus Gracilibacteria bacterium]|jgi:MFS family permease
MHKIKTPHDSKHGKIFSWMVLILGFSTSLIYPIFPNYIKEIVKTDQNVSWFYASMAIAMLVGALLSTMIFKKIARTKITTWGFFFSIFIFFGFVFVTRLHELSFLAVLHVWIKLFLLMSLSLFVRDFSRMKDLGEEEGYYYKFNNIGLFIGPLIGGFLAALLNYEIIFIFSAIVSFIGLIYFYHQHIYVKHPALIKEEINIHQPNIISNIKEFFTERNRILSYFITLTMMTFLGFRNLYIPLYVVSQGYLESVSGIILALGVLPLILLEVKVGKYADKKGLRLPISFGFLIMGITLILIALSPYILLNFVLLILSNIGMALVEPLQEDLLFKNLSKEKENNLYGVYMTADPVGFFISSAFGALILIFLNFNALFFAFGILTLLSCIASLKLIKES